MKSRVRTNTPTPLGRTLRQERMRRDLSQEALAEMAGISKTSVAYIEAGKIQAPSAFIVYALASSLGVRMEVLMGVPRVEITTKGRSRARSHG